MMFDVEDAFVWSLFLLFLVLAIIGIVCLLAPKQIDYYYISMQDHKTPCVWSHWTWHTDEIAYCTDDKDKALDFMAKANASIHASH